MNDPVVLRSVNAEFVRAGAARAEDHTALLQPFVGKRGPVALADGAGARRPVKVGSVVWTVAWASVMSLCALAGGGYLTWFLVYLHWKYFLG